MPALHDPSLTLDIHQSLFLPIGSSRLLTQKLLKPRFDTIRHPDVPLLFQTDPLVMSSSIYELRAGKATVFQPLFVADVVISSKIQERVVRVLLRLFYFLGELG